MANRYWVGGTATWDATAGSKWSTTSGGGGGSAVPTAADDVFFDAASGAVTITTSGTTTDVCRSLNCTGFTGTLSHAAATTIAIGDGTAGAGNVALLLVSGMTYTVGSATTSIINFVSTSATVQTITSGTKIMPSWTINGAGSSYQLTDANTVASTSTVTLTAGTLNTNNQTCSWGTFNSNNTNTRTLTLGSSAIAITGTGTAWNLITTTNMTLTASTATITLTGASGTFQAGGLTNYPSVTMSGSAIAQLSGTGATFVNFTRTGTAVKTDSLSLFGNFTITGTLTLTGNSTTNRLLVQSSTVGTTRTLTAAAVSLTNADFMDITGVGAAAPFTGTSMGDALGNSGITFDTPVTRYAVNAGGWSTTNRWSATSGGLGGASVPLSQDTVIFDASSGVGTYTADMPRLGKSLDFTGFAGTASLTSTANSLYGSLTLASGMTFTTSVTTTFAGRSTHTITSNGKVFTGSVVVNAPGGSYTMQDAFSMGPTGIGTFQLNYGGWITQGFTFTAGRLDLALSSTRTFDLGSSTVNITSATPPANISVFITSTNLTFTGSNANLVLTTAAATSRSFTLGGTTWSSLTYTVANSPGPIVIAGANTFGTFNIGNGRVLTMPSSTVNTIASGGSFNVNGVNNGYLYLPGVSANYASVPDSAALSVTGDIDMRVRVALDDWTPAINNLLLSKRASAAQYSFAFWIDTTGKPNLGLTPDGSTNTTATSTASVSFTDLLAGWVRVTWRASDGRVQFFTAADSVGMPAVWTQLGSDGTIAIGSIFDSTSVLELGSQLNGTSGPMAGKFYRAQIRNNILDNGTGIVFDADFTTKPFGANSFTESSSNAATVTINGTTAQAGDGRVLLDSSTPGTAATLSKSSGTTSVNYLSIKDSTATGGASWFAGANSVSVSGNSGWNFRASSPQEGNFFQVM